MAVTLPNQPPDSRSSDAATRSGESSAAAPNTGGGVRVQLVRDFIQDSLYHPTHGYFSKHTALGKQERELLPGQRGWQQPVPC